MESGSEGETVCCANQPLNEAYESEGELGWLTRGGGEEDSWTSSSSIIWRFGSSVMSVPLCGDTNHAVELHVVVKFYHRGAHELLAAQELAPELYHCRWEDDVEMVVVVIEFIKNGDCRPNSRITCAICTPSRCDVRSRRCTRKSGCLATCGAPNVLFEGDRVQLIDFD